MKTHTRLSLLILLITSLNSFAQIFGDQNIIAQTEANAPKSIYSTDLDGDGDQDVLSASYSDNKIAWYENIDGIGTFGEQQVITNNANGAMSVYVTDIDGDGDQDVLSASELDNKIAWYENIDGIGTFGEQQVITIAAGRAKSVFAIDIDGDGDQDVIFVSNTSLANEISKIAWHENIDGNGTFGNEHIITYSTESTFSAYATDVDGDGDQDILSASNIDGIVAWFENTDGNGTFGSQHVIATSINGAHSVYATDIDGDDDKDILSISDFGHKIIWFENTDGNGTFGIQQVVTAAANGASTIYTTDIDGDGDQDVLSASFNYDKIAWYENTDGNGTFGVQQIIITAIDGVAAIFTTDIDGDDDQDVLSASTHDDKLAWYENIDGNGIFGIQLVITKTSLGRAHSVYATDIDGDSDMDVLSASHYKIAWFENIDGNGTFGALRDISNPVNHANSVYATDIDGDGDQDVISDSYDDNTIIWYENTDGNGTFGEQKIIATDVNLPKSVYATDIDGDGDQDVLSASFHNIAWFENTDGNGTFGTQHPIMTSANNPWSVYATDIDGDGDQDVLSAHYFGNKIAWYENMDGYGTFGVQQIITTNTDHAVCVFASDIDGDGDMDVLSASMWDDKIAWYENMDGYGIFGVQQVITTYTDGAVCVFASDIDGDRDMDVLSVSMYNNSVSWYENIDGNGTFGAQQVITTSVDNPQSVYVTDIDSDGDQDILSASQSDDKIAWYENLGPIGVNQNKLVEFSIFPNPTDDILKIQSENSIAKIEIYNKLGQLTLTVSNKKEIEISSLQNGIYFIKITNKYGITGVEKVIKM